MTNTKVHYNILLQSYCASFALDLRRGKKREDSLLHFHSLLHQMMCFETATEAELCATMDESAVKPGSDCVLSSHS